MENHTEIWKISWERKMPKPRTRYSRVGGFKKAPESLQTNHKNDAKNDPKTL